MHLFQKGLLDGEEGPGQLSVPPQSHSQPSLLPELQQGKPECYLAQSKGPSNLAVRELNFAQGEESHA